MMMPVCPVCGRRLWIRSNLNPERFECLTRYLDVRGEDCAPCYNWALRIIRRHAWGIR